MKHLYIFNEGLRASAYGIGTYIQQLSLCMAGKKTVSLNIVNLHSNEKEFKSEKLSNGGIIYHFPAVNGFVNYSERYYRNVWIILSSLIKINHKSDQLFFHLNYTSQYPFVKLMKEKYSFCKVFFSIHYLDWCFMLKGNTRYFRQIINANKKQLQGIEKTVYNSYEIDKLIYQAMDHIICLSKYTQRLLINDYQIPTDKISVIYNGLKDEAVLLSEKEKAVEKEKLFFDKEEKIILFVGRLDEFKGVGILINAFKKILENHFEYRLIIVGDGNFAQYLKESNGYHSKITFTGRLEKEDLYRFYRIADVGVIPSTNEQCSYVAIEMMMFGIPLIASDSTGLSEMLIEQNTKYKIDVEEENTNFQISSLNLKQKIIIALLDHEFSVRIHKQYEKKYTLEKMKEKYMDLYSIDL